ncbi:MAG: aldehyde ferredoxin oxidoreductase C-terminal domain-containing protein, partial [Chloroflexota bacterium]|nr:aldehyde ferredoxin oxidoreductase C-terminal domain-containing protein [Chloroflexota bacterium]
LVFDSIKYDIEDLNQSLKRWELSNRWGVDSAAFGRLFDFAVGLYQEGIITREDTGGMELKLGYETFVRLLEMTVKKEGFGALLAQGFNGFMKRIGKGCEKYAVQVKGQDLDQDPRGSFGFETFGSAVNFRPGSDLPAGGHTMVGGRPLSYFQYQANSVWGVPEDAKRRIFADPEGFDIGYLQPHYEGWATVLNCLGLCFRLQSSRLYPVGLCADLYSAATGFDVTPAELLKAAERVWNVGKASNAREGFSRKDDWWPDVYFDKPLKFQGTELPLMDYFKKRRISREAFGVLLDHYYEERGWDIESGIPGRRKLMELGLDEVAEDLGS